MAGCRLYAVELPSTSYLVKNYDYYPAATYWKNGRPIALNDTTNGKTYANGIFSQDGDVYAAGLNHTPGHGLQVLSLMTSGDIHYVVRYMWAITTM